MARVNGDPMYQSYRHGFSLDKRVEELLSASGVDLSNGGGLQENSFKATFLTTKLLFMTV
jgi:hypothetical protein